LLITEKLVLTKEYPNESNTANNTRDK
ncbi:MAG: hypothetical protein QG641_1222, partial [Candidatus Poribacteria bacterium]|nr:hypothetical protein [Candidatus Poribacteria bacterium]